MSEQAVATGPSAGALLRHARESAGLHVAALAVSLKVPVRKLEALEEDRYDELTDAVFARALALSVCRTLKVDAQPILDRLPQSSAPRLIRADEGLGTPFRAPGDAAPPGLRDHLLRPVPLTVGALLLGALILLLLPGVRREEAAVAAAKPEPAAASMAAPVLLQPSSAGEPVAAASSPVHAAPAEAPSAPAAAAASPAVTAGVASTAAPALATTVSTATPAPASGLVVFRTTGPSWIEVIDAQGNVALRRLLDAGESVGASGSPPLAVTVGSASTTTVEVRGRKFDLAPVSRDNVARFEVK